MATIKHFAVLVAGAMSLGMASQSLARQDLPLEPGQIWTHRNSGIDLPARIGDLSRTGGTQFAEAELDVAISFTRPEAGDAVTFFVFRNTNGVAPVWLAQAQRSIEGGNSLGAPVLKIAPRAFAPPRQSRTTGLLAAYALTGKAYASTGVAMFPVGDWYVKVRATSATRSPEQNVAWMKELISALRLPPPAGEPLAAPVATCAAPLKGQAATQSPATSGAGMSVWGPMTSAIART